MSEQRLSVTFGAFSCDVVGYDDPFAMLNRVVGLFGEVAKSNPAFGAGQVKMSDLERAQVAAGLATHASRIEEMADQSATGGLRYVVTKDEDETDTAEVDDVDSAIVENAVEDHVVVAAVVDDAPTGGDLELRDTLEATVTTVVISEDETVALDVGSDSAPEVDEPAPEAIELSDTPVSSEAPLAIVTNEFETNSVDHLPEEVATNWVETAQQAHDEATTDIPESVSVAVETQPEIQATEEPLINTPLRKPLRLDMPVAAEPAAEASEKVADKEPQATVHTKSDKKPRVTVTKLPLRPERPKTEVKQTLTPVQKVEPVVTLNPTIADSAIAALKPSRAERVKSKMDQRNADDDEDNFLFADVDEAIRKAGIEAIPTTDDTEPRNADLAPESSNKPVEADKKPRRSFANLLGFRKSAKIAPESALDDAKASETNHTVGVDGFDRLRESVAAAMPAADDQVVQYSQNMRQPESISEAIDYDDESSPTHFARRVGATTLQDLLEASAVYMDLVEGKSRFSRRDVMQAFNQIGADKDYSQEARLKSFRKLLTSGSLVKVDDGMFTVSQATRFGYETQLQA